MAQVVTVGSRVRMYRDFIRNQLTGLDDIVIGIQHHILARLFLVQFDPGIPKVGTNRRTALKRMTVGTLRHRFWRITN